MQVALRGVAAVEGEEAAFPGGFRGGSFVGGGSVEFARGGCRGGGYGEVFGVWDGRVGDEVAHCVDVEALVALVGGLRAEEEEEGQHGGREDGDEVESPLVADVCGDFPDEDRREECAAEEGEVAQCHSETSLVHEVEIAHAGVDQRFEGGESNALEYTRPQERFVRSAVAAAPCAGEDDGDGAEEVDVSLSPYARRRYEEEACETDAEEVVPCEERHVGEGALEVDGERDGVCGEERGQRRGDDAQQAQNAHDQVALPQWPILPYRQRISLMNVSLEHVETEARVQGDRSGRPTAAAQAVSSPSCHT